MLQLNGKIMIPESHIRKIYINLYVNPATTSTVYYTRVIPVNLSSLPELGVRGVMLQLIELILAVYLVHKSGFRKASQNYTE